MTNFILIVAAIVVCLLAYAILGRPWLKSKPWAAGFFAWIDPFEIALFKKSETILVGRLVWVGGAMVTLYDSLAVFASPLDITPLTTRAFDFIGIPADMRGIVGTGIIASIGLLINWLRARTTKPLETVAIAEKDITPAVQQALDTADIAKDQAVAAVTDAKAA